ncbi:MAG TPA: hypothetical protein VKB79_25915 [Bryobacteraceae bacterium]|nr:hypothetical protein [Bryobacteraceae bacterium]
MKRAAYSFLVAVALLVAHRSAAAKAVTAKITIAGGGLAGPIEVRDQRLRDLSGWGGPWADGVAAQPERGRLYYELSFYFENEVHDMVKNYIVYYYPPGPNGRGVIYRPGNGAIWELNAGTIYRRGEEGRWLYAARDWDAAWVAAMGPDVLAKGEAPRSRAAVSVDGWTKPESGWLYVLDPQSERDAPGSRVWLFDPTTAKVMGSIRAGYEPDYALSADGSKLYVVSGERESGELTVVDTATGTLRHVPFPGRVLYQPHYRELPPYSGVAFDSGRQALAISGWNVLSPDRIESQVWLFDLRKETFLGEKGACGSGDFAASSACGEARARFGRLRFTAGSRTYAGYGGGTPDNLSAAKELKVFDTDTSREIGLVETSVPFWSATASPDGKWIYALAPAQHRILTIDAAVLREVQAADVGIRPSSAIVAP